MRVHSFAVGAVSSALLLVSLGCSLKPIVHTSLRVQEISLSSIAPLACVIRTMGAVIMREGNSVRNVLNQETGGSEVGQRVAEHLVWGGAV
jgi:hypothetical protein